MSLRDRLVFALVGSIVDSIGNSIPNFDRPSSLWLETQTKLGLLLHLVEPHHPAFLKDGSIYLEGDSVNEITQNTSLSPPLWQAGQNVRVQPDLARIPSQRVYGDRLIFAGNPQDTKQSNTISRTWYLPPHTEYTFSVLLRSFNGNFTPADTIRVTGSVEGAGTITLAALNDFPQQYQIYSLTFKTFGTKNIENFRASRWEVASRSANRITLDKIDTSNPEILPNELLASRLLVEDLGYYEILGNSAFDSNTGLFDVELVAREDRGFPDPGDSVRIVDAPLLPVNIEISCTSAVIFDVGALRLEPNNYRTCFNFQFDQIESKAFSSLVYPSSPIAELNEFALSIAVSYWRGRATLWKSAELSIEVEGDTLEIQINGIRRTITLPSITTSFVLVLNCIPRPIPRVQVYLDGKFSLEFATAIAGADDSLDLSQRSGVLALGHLLVFDRHLDPGDTVLLGSASGEVKQLFDSPGIVNASDLAASPKIYLSEVEIPPATTPTAEAFVIDIDTVTKTLLVDKSEGFELGAPVSVLRYIGATPSLILTTTVVNVSLEQNLIRLFEVTNIRREDYLIVGSTEQAGSVSVRFPYRTIAKSRITAVYPEQLRIQLDATSGFDRGAVLVETSTYRSVAEIQIVALDHNLKQVIVSSVKDLQVGQILIRGDRPTSISPVNYYATLAAPQTSHSSGASRILIAHQYRNGLLLKNFNPFPVRVAPILKLAL